MIYIIGAGLAGLLLGYNLQKHGCSDFKIFESSSTAGGAMKKLQPAGFKTAFPFGVRQINLIGEGALDLMKELGLPIDIRQHDGRFFDFIHLDETVDRFIALPLEKYFGEKMPEQEFKTMAELFRAYNNPLLQVALQGYL